MGSRKKNTYNVLWLAMFFSSFIYLPLAFFIKKAAPPPVEGSVFVYALAAVALSCFAASVILFKTMFTTEKIKTFSEFYQFTSYFQRKAVVCMTLMADIGVIGVVLKIFGYPLLHSAVFIFAGSAGLIVHRLQAEALWKSVVEDPALMAKMKMMN